MKFQKPADNVLKKTKDHRRSKRNKRSEALKFDKDNAFCIAACAEDENEKRCIDGNDVVKDFVLADDSVDADCSDAEKERE